MIPNSVASRPIRAFSLTVAVSLFLAACGQSNEGPAIAPDASPQPAEAEKTAILASLPAPFDTADLENGRRVFARCRSCHTITPNGPNMTGPNLYKVFGREVGSRPNYRYSRALEEASFIWDAEKMAEFLARPREYLPGNKMSFVGIAAAQDRRDVIAFLKVETGYRPQDTAVAASSE